MYVLIYEAVSVLYLCMYVCAGLEPVCSSKAMVFVGEAFLMIVSEENVFKSPEVLTYIHTYIHTYILTYIHIKNNLKSIFLYHSLMCILIFDTCIND